MDIKKRKKEELRREKREKKRKELDDYKRNLNVDGDDNSDASDSQTSRSSSYSDVSADSMVGKKKKFINMFNECDETNYLSTSYSLISNLAFQQNSSSESLEPKHSQIHTNTYKSNSPIFINLDDGDEDDRLMNEFDIL
jgi:hypothetical protein